MKDNKHSDNLNFSEYKYIAIGMLIVVATIYLAFNTTDNTSSNQIASWGAVGDFFGGILNPTFALLGLFALLATIKLQTIELRHSSKALENSHEELKLTREESKKATTALQQQSKSIKLQNFENTFFKMLDLHSEITKSFHLQKNIQHIKSSINDIPIQFHYNNKGKVYKEAIVELDRTLNRLLINFNTLKNYQSVDNIEDVPKNFINQIDNTNELYIVFYKEFQQYLSHYFRNIYQILKFISKTKGINKKFYTNIFRSQISEPELRLLFYNVSSVMGRDKALPLLVECEFLEHLPYDANINRKDVKLYIKKALELGYKPSKVFGQSEWNDGSREWEVICKELTQEVLVEITEHNPTECVDNSLE
ncbi:putative phage abortive infection protein [Sulfurimonas sp.]